MIEKWDYGVLVGALLGFVHLLTLGKPLGPDVRTFLIKIATDYCICMCLSQPGAG